MPDASSEEPRSASQRLNAQLAALREKLESEAGLEERLWAALDRSVGLLERRLTSVEITVSSPATATDLAALTCHGATIGHLTETMDRLGLLEPPPPPVEAPEPDMNEVWVAAGEAGHSTYACDAIVARLRERYEGRA